MTIRLLCAGEQNSAYGSTNSRLAEQQHNGRHRWRDPVRQFFASSDGDEDAKGDVVGDNPAVVRRLRRVGPGAGDRGRATGPTTLCQVRTFGNVVSVEFTSMG